jgi:polyhydroxyalkanoate synthase subunit PhaC
VTAVADNHQDQSTGARAAARAALDVMLTDAAISPSMPGRLLQPRAGGRLAASLVRRPQRVVRRGGGLGVELARVLAGASELTPSKSDRRFTDRGWTDSWFFHRLMQTYLAVGASVDGLIADANLDWRSEQQVRFVARNLLDALAPTNFPLSNPEVIRETVDRGGANLVKGGQRLVRDVVKGRLPAMVDTSKFEVGRNLAVTPGAVVARTDVFELIQYAPQVDTVYEVPLLIVPPTINKYYALDMAPGRSLVEYLLHQGHQVFMISWRNPEQAHGHFDYDTYAQAILDARDRCGEIAGQPTAHVMAACSGGMIAVGALAHRAVDSGLDGVASLTLLVCPIDNERGGTAAAFTTREIAAAAAAQSARRGYLDGNALQNVFAWLRPNDLVWNYVVNNYMLGKEPPAFDILYWSQDVVRLAAGLHRDFLTIALDNALTIPGGFRVLGTDVDLGDIRLDNYIVAGSTDHIVRWRNAYQSTQLLSGDSRFILSTSGHIQALINPPDGWAGAVSRSSYRVADSHPADTAAWEAEAVTKAGSWWPDYSAWLGERSGERVRAKRGLGSRRYRPVADAPGTYVMAA